MKQQILIGLFGLSLIACENKEPKAPTIVYQANAIECQAGETITFTPSGTADFVSFWSGEKGSNYHFIKQATPTEATFSFTHRSWTTISDDDMEFKVLLSKDYIPQTVMQTGIMSAQAIRKATWEDITNEVYTPNKNSSVFKKSIDWNLIKYKDTPFFIAFMHKHTKGSAQDFFINKVEINRKTTELGVENNIINPVTTIAFAGTINTTYWYSLVTLNLEEDPNHNSNNASRTWTSVASIAGASGSCAVARGYSYTLNGQLRTEEKWLISPIINLKSGEKDKGIAIKSREGLMRPHEHVYQKPGVYKAVFVSTNSYLGGEKQQIQEFTITVK